MKHGMIFLALLIGIAIGGLAAPAAASGSYMNASYVDTTVRLAGDGSAHVEQMLLIEDVSRSPVVAGAITVRLSGNDGLIGQVLGAPRNFSNVSVARADGRPLQYTVNQSGGVTTIEALCEDIMLEHWNTKLIVTYDVDPAVSRGLLTSTFSMAGGVSGYGLGNTSLVVALPPDSRVIYASPGAVVGNGSVSWSGEVARGVTMEYSRLPVPEMLPVSFQYTFWAIMVLGALATGLVIARW